MAGRKAASVMMAPAVLAGRRWLLVLMVLVQAGLPGVCVASESATLAAPAYPRIRASREARLQAALEQVMANLKLTSAVRARRLAVTVVDLADLRRPRMAGVNGDHMMYSASLPKIAILLGAFARIEEGALELTPKLQATLEAMIRKSSNPAATETLNLVGGAYLIELLRSERYNLYDPGQGGGLWVGKPYGKQAAYQRDPLHGLSHGATSMKVARFYYLMETGRLVSAEASRRMKAILGEPAIRHKFVKGLAERFPQVRMFRKSGTWRNYHSDSAIVEHGGKHYILVALSDDPQGSAWMEKLAVALDRIMTVRQPGRERP